MADWKPAMYAGRMAHTTGVTFSVQAPIGSVVHVAGDFNDWDQEADVLTDTQGNGSFAATVTVPKGRFPAYP